MKNLWVYILGFISIALVIFIGAYFVLGSVGNVSGNISGSCGLYQGSQTMGPGMMSNWTDFPFLSGFFMIIGFILIPVTLLVLIVLGIVLIVKLVNKKPETATNEIQE